MKIKKKIHHCWNTSSSDSHRKGDFTWTRVVPGLSSWELPFCSPNQQDRALLLALTLLWARTYWVVLPSALGGVSISFPLMGLGWCEGSRPQGFLWTGRDAPRPFFLWVLGSSWVAVGTEV